MENRKLELDAGFRWWCNWSANQANNLPPFPHRVEHHRSPPPNWYFSSSWNSWETPLCLRRKRMIYCRYSSGFHLHFLWETLSIRDKLCESVSFPALVVCFICDFLKSKTDLISSTTVMSWALKWILTNYNCALEMLAQSIRRCFLWLKNPC